MKKEINDKNPTTTKSGSEGKVSLEGYPLYPPSEDIYSQNQRVENTVQMDAFGDGGKIEKIYDAKGIEVNNEKDFDDDVSGSDLDIPGSELDDEQEDIGNEDEENNYYSIGGDRHEDLEEDRGE